MGSRGRPVDLEDLLGLPKKALIFGTTGEDGSFLAEFLLAKRYQVYGAVRRAWTFNTQRLDGTYAA
ncbi:MAG TPA: GDP-mannose 4,6-dehydratase [Bryobacteraceae bacterium]|nr:GDP-mannose 4,6-dehydratase [Bryobacteraceae bacterium]